MLTLFRLQDNKLSLHYTTYIKNFINLQFFVLKWQYNINIILFITNVNILMFVLHKKKIIPENYVNFPSSLV